MAFSFTLFDHFPVDVAGKVHNFDDTGDTLKVYLSNTAPDVAGDAVKADLAEIATGSGYSGPIDVANDIGSPSTGGDVPIVGTNITITASGGSIGPFRYVVLYNDTPTSPADPLIGYWDYGTAITLLDGQALQLNFYTDGTYTRAIFFLENV